MARHCKCCGKKGCDRNEKEAEFEWEVEMDSAQAENNCKKNDYFCPGFTRGFVEKVCFFEFFS